MKKNTLVIILISFIAIILGAYAVMVVLPRQRIKALLKNIQLPPGFTITLYAWPVPDARQLAVGDAGTVFVGSRSEGKVYALPDKNKDSRADRVITIARDLRIPNGVAFYHGALYVAEMNRIVKFENIEKSLSRVPMPRVVNSNLPEDVMHGWKYIRVGPDGLLYVPQGAPCNACRQKDKRYASILRIQFDGKGMEVFAHGVRNMGGFDWHPRTKEMWFTDNGREGLPNAAVDDELNGAPYKSMHFGFPYCHASDIADPEFGAQRSCAKLAGPALVFNAPVAPSGVKFYTGKMFPSEYENCLFIAEHGAEGTPGSPGFQVSMVKTGSHPRYAVFAHGWVRKGIAWGRPVDIVLMPDGALLVSDDRVGAIYRIAYKK